MLNTCADLVVRKDSDVVGQSLGQAGNGVLAGRRATLGRVGDNFLVRSKRAAVASGTEGFLGVPFDLVLGDRRSTIRRWGVPQHPRKKANDTGENFPDNRPTVS